MNIKHAEVHLESLSFDEKSIPSKSKQGSKSNDTDVYADLAMSEFDASLSDFNFSSPDTVNSLVVGNALLDFRHVFQFQLLQRGIFSTAVLFNQVALDDYFAEERMDSTFITASIHGNKLFEPVISKSQLQTYFLSVAELKSSSRSKALMDYHSISENIVSGKNTILMKKKIKELKLKLAAEYCEDMARVVLPYMIKLQIIGACHDIRLNLAKIPLEDKGFEIGLANDPIVAIAQPAGKSIVSAQVPTKNFTCSLIARDGQVLNAMYIPHFVQIMRMEFAIGESSAPNSVVFTNTELLGLLLSIIQCHNILLLFMFMQFELLEDKSMSHRKKMEKIVSELKKVSVELQNLSDTSSPIAVRNLLQTKCHSLSIKTMATLHNLIYRLRLNLNMKAGDQVAEQLRSFSIPAADSHPLHKYWPLVESNPDQWHHFVALKDCQNGTNFDFLKCFLIFLSESDMNYFKAEWMNVSEKCLLIILLD